MIKHSRKRIAKNRYQSIGRRLIRQYFSELFSYRQQIASSWNLSNASEFCAGVFSRLGLSHFKERAGSKYLAQNGLLAIPGIKRIGPRVRRRVFFESLEARDLFAVFTASNGIDALVIEQDSNPNNLIVRSTNNSVASQTFAKNVGQLTIDLGLGADTLTFGNLGANVSTEIIVVGSGSIPLAGNFADTLLFGKDTVNFTADLTLEGKDLSVDAETITVNPNVTISTRKLNSGTPLNGNSSANSGIVTFTGQNIELKSGSKVLAQVESGSAFTAGDISFSVNAYSIVRTSSDDPPKSSIVLNTATVQGRAIEFDAQASERFGVFGFKKVATTEISVDSSTVIGTSVLMNALADTTLVPDLEIEMSNPSSTTLTFNDNPTGDPTITRSTGNWLLDKFLLLQSIDVVDSLNNDGAFQIKSISLDGKTLSINRDSQPVDSKTVFQAETAVNTVRVTGTSILPSTEDVVDRLFGFTGSAIVSLNNTTAKAKIFGSSNVTATNGSVELNAQSDGRATPFSPNLAIPKAISHQRRSSLGRYDGPGRCDYRGYERGCGKQQSQGQCADQQFGRSHTGDELQEYAGQYCICRSQN